MSYTIAGYLTKKGYKIGLDVIRVNLNTPVKISCPGKESRNDTMSFLKYLGPCFHDGKGVGMIANPLTKEYFVSLDQDLIRDVAKEFNLSKKPSVSDMASHLEFSDKKMQKIWEQHTNYMTPKMIERQQAEALARQQEAMENKIPFKTIKDIIRRGGFTPNDYVELKDKMTVGYNVGPYKQSREIKLPKPGNISEKSYIVTDSNRFIIGDTGTNEAIMTYNDELLNEFLNQGFEYRSYDNFEDLFYTSEYERWIVVGESMFLDNPDMHFKDKQVQNRLETHRRHQNKQNRLIKNQILKYIKQHYSELKHEVKFTDVSCEMDDLIKNLATKHVLQDRAIARRATRNLTTTYDEKRNQALAEALREKRKPQKIELRTIDIPEKQVIKPNLSALRQQMLQQRFNDHSRS